jgi:Leucine rich repeat variant
MSDWLGDVIGNNLIAVYEGLDATEDALIWLREKPRTFGELRSEDIDWLRWMAANAHDKDILEKLSQDRDSDVRMWVACNPMTPKPILEKLAEDPVVFVRRGVAQNSRTPPPVLAKLSDDADVVVRALALKSRSKATPLFPR